MVFFADCPRQTDRQTNVSGEETAAIIISDTDEWRRESLFWADMVRHGHFPPPRNERGKVSKLPKYLFPLKKDPTLTIIF